MTQQSGNQFDDDLTVGMEDNGSFSTDSIDLFEFSNDEESPIARLKTIILSIDWEINDDILQQLDDELVDLSDVWAGDKIKLIYVQGLAKMGKYILKEKARAHPDAIKLLITFYHNLEKIVSSSDLVSEEEKKKLLLEDVRKFDKLKSQIGKPSGDSAAEVPLKEETVPENEEVKELQNLKGLVLSVDLEITEQTIKKLNAEVQRLEGVFGQDKAKRILLQGIGALSSYISKMRSQSNSHAFSILRSFFDVLEKISSATLTATDEKRLLLAEVEKFNGFKGEIAKAQNQVEPVQEKVAAAPIASSQHKENKRKKETEILPAEDEEGEEEVAGDVASRLESVFGNIGLDDDDETTLDTNAALEGVNVETEADDESDEDALPIGDDGVAPALAEVDDESSFSTAKLAGDLAPLEEEEKKEKAVVEEVESVIPGIDVESEADDDSDEDALPSDGGELAPALSASDDDYGFDEESIGEESVGSDTDTDDLDMRLGSFFDDEVQSSSQEWGDEGDEGLSGVTMEDPDITLPEAAIAPALSDETVEVPAFVAEEPVAENTDVGALSFLDEDEADEPVTSFLEAVDDEIALTEELAVAPALTDDFDELTTIDLEDAVSEKTDDALSFLDEAVEPVAESIAAEIQLSEEPVSPVVNEEIDGFAGMEAEEIVFDVPDEDVSPVAEALSGNAEFDEDDDEGLDFQVPGEESETVVQESEELVFDAVSDEVAVDEFLGQASSDAYGSLEGVIISFKEKLTTESLQDIFIEIERLKRLSGSNNLEKIFLQLLVTLCHNLERNIENPDRSVLVLLDGIFEGIQKNASDDAVPEQIQEHLLSCTSQVLSLQQKDILSAQKEKMVKVNSAKDDDLATFVQGELAEMRQLFFDEIKTLREELSNK